MLTFVVKEGGVLNCNCLNPYCRKNKAILISILLEKDSDDSFWRLTMVEILSFLHFLSITSRSFDSDPRAMQRKAAF